MLLRLAKVRLSILGTLRERAKGESPQDAQCCSRKHVLAYSGRSEREASSELKLAPAHRRAGDLADGRVVAIRRVDRCARIRKARMIEEVGRVKAQLQRCPFPLGH